MSITNERRHQLYQRLEQVLGPEEATTMMDHLPPVGWSEVSTKADLSAMTEVLRAETRTLGSDIRAELYKSQRDTVLALIGSNAAFAALLFAALRLTA